MTIRICLIAFSLALCACGDDDASDHDDGDHDHVADSGAQGGAGGDSGAFGDVMCKPGGGGACQNADDCPIILAGTARSAAQTCGLGCIGNADTTACSRACVVKETSLSEDCADCYVGIVSCSFEHCVSQCASDAESQACFQCQVDNKCRSTFDTCSGLPPVTSP